MLTLFKIYNKTQRKRENTLTKTVYFLVSNFCVNGHLRAVARNPSPQNLQNSKVQIIIAYILFPPISGCWYVFGGWCGTMIQSNYLSRSHNFTHEQQVSYTEFCIESFGRIILVKLKLGPSFMQQKKCLSQCLISHILLIIHVI